jgi:hypothetical protein
MVFPRRFGSAVPSHPAMDNDYTRLVHDTPPAAETAFFADGAAHRCGEPTVIYAIGVTVGPFCGIMAVVVADADGETLF